MEIVGQGLDILHGVSLLGAGGLGKMSASQLVMLVLGVMGLTAVMLSTRNRLRKTMKKPVGSVRTRYADQSRVSAAKHEVEDVLFELDKLARHVNGQLDLRFAKLEAVIRDADERIHRLSRLAQSGEGLPAEDTTRDEDGPPPPASSPPSPDKAESSRYEIVYLLADRGLSAAQIAEKVHKTNGEVELILALRKTKEQAARMRAVASCEPSR